MVVIEGSARIDSARWTEARPIMEKMIRASRAEPGCLEYAYAVDLLEPDRLRIIERWVDRAALAAHLATPHLAEFRATLADIEPRELSLRLFDAEPQPFPGTGG